MDVEAYLKRINFEDDPQVDLATLERLIQCHLKAVSWENVDLFLGKDIVLDMAHVYDRVVVAGRGGWCHQLNGIFCWLLRQLGFRVDMLNTRMWNTQTGTFGAHFDHMALAVHLNGERYLADVAWAGHVRTPSVPLPIIEGKTVPCPSATFRMIREPDDIWVPEFLDGPKGWSRFIGFYLQPRELQDFEKRGQEMQIPGFVLADRLTLGRMVDHSTQVLWHTIRFRNYYLCKAAGDETMECLEKEENVTPERLALLLQDKFDMSVDLSNLDMTRWLPQQRAN